MSEWFRIENKSNYNDLYIYEEITNSKELVSKLDKLNKSQDIHLHLNSPGGDLYAAISLLSLLKKFNGKKVAWVDGLAASAAAYLLTGMDRTLAYPNSLIMLHAASTDIHGNAKEMRALADNLDKVNKTLIDSFKQKTKQPDEIVTGWFDKDTWMTAEEAQQVGLIDEICVGKAITNSLKFNNYDYRQIKIDMMVKRLNRKFRGL